MIDVLEPEFDNGYGKFSRWDSFRADTKMDQCGIVYRKGKKVFVN